MAIKQCLVCGNDYKTNHPTRAKYCGLVCNGVALSALQRPPRKPRKRNKAPDGYFVWRAIKARCFYPRQESYSNYGGRGITVCARWAASFADFMADMGPRPPGTSIDRIDNDGNYEPGNCRWATMAEQGSNKRTTRLFVVNGKSDSLSGHAKTAGMEPDTVRRRIDVQGMSIEVALSLPAVRGQKLPRADKGEFK